jgi:hypothetical protein
MNGKTCNVCLYPETANGCETPGCDSSIWMTGTVREQRKRDQADAQERARIQAIRSQYVAQAW